MWPGRPPLTLAGPPAAEAVLYRNVTLIDAVAHDPTAEIEALKTLAFMVKRGREYR